MCYEIGQLRVLLTAERTERRHASRSARFTCSHRLQSAAPASLPNRRLLAACHTKGELGNELGANAGGRIFLATMAKRPRKGYPSVARPGDVRVGTGSDRSRSARAGS